MSAFEIFQVRIDFKEEFRKIFMQYFHIFDILLGIQSKKSISGHGG